MQLPWRDLAPGNGPAINTSLTEAETEELKKLAVRRRWAQHTSDCSLNTTHHLTCTCGAYSRPWVSDVLEIGSAFGYSTVALALAGAKVVAVDPHNWLDSYGQMVANLSYYQVTSQVEIIREDSRAALPRFAEEGRGFDLVWIDGDHAADMVAHDVEWALKLLREGGTLACHDLDEVSCPGVRQALDAWRQPDYVVDTLAVYVDPSGAVRR